MISNLSSYLECFVAVYVTMCLNNEMFESFWTSTYYRDIHKKLDSVKEIKQHPNFSQLIDAIKNVHFKVYTQTRIRGGYMLSYTLLLLVLIGYEPSGSSLSFDIPIFVSFIFTLFFLILHMLLNFNWKCLLLTVIVLYSLTAYLYLHHRDVSFVVYKTGNSFDDVVNTFLLQFSRHKRICILFLITLPVCYSLFLNWLKSRIYKSYLLNKIENETNSFLKACEAIRTKQNKGIREDYKKAIESSVWEEEWDWSTKNIIELLNENIAAAAEAPKAHVLLLSFLKHKYDIIRKLFNNKKRNQDNKESQVYSPSLPSVAVSTDAEINTYPKKYEKFCKEQKVSNVKLRAFCEKENIDSKKFISWIRLYYPKKKKQN